MAQIDREGGNQSGLGEAFNSYNHSLTLEKKICSHTQIIMPMLREKENRLREDRQERYNKEKLEHGVGRDFPKCFHSLF